MGVTVRERPENSGVYWVFINHKGKRKAKKVGRDRKQALDVAKKIDAKLTLNGLDIFTDKPQAPLFNEYADNWLETFVKTQRRLGTYERYRDILTKYIYPVLGNMRITEIKKSDAKNLLLSIVFPSQPSRIASLPAPRPII